MFPFGFLVGWIFWVLMLITASRHSATASVWSLSRLSLAALSQRQLGDFFRHCRGDTVYRYVPRLKEIYGKAGNLSHAIRRKNLKDRF